MGGSVKVERRRAPRRSPPATDPLSRVRLRTGRDLAVVNVSHSGALVEGGARLLPGTHVDVHVTTTGGRVLVRSRVVRAYVSDVRPNHIRYRGAVVFDRAVSTDIGYSVPDPRQAASAIMGSDYPLVRDTTPAVPGERPSF